MLINRTVYELNLAQKDFKLTKTLARDLDAVFTLRKNWKALQSQFPKDKTCDRKFCFCFHKLFDSTDDACLSILFQFSFLKIEMWLDDLFPGEWKFSMAVVPIFLLCIAPTEASYEFPAYRMYQYDYQSADITDREAFGSSGAQVSFEGRAPDAKVFVLS